jgi:(E)-4-hydroxy-3-methyl-but-2-enyl pyrophosphate reductase
MEIVLSKYAGFCEGVARAYDIVEKIAKDPKTRRPVFVLDSLVHNSDVVAKIESLGVKKISVTPNIIDVLEKTKIGTLVITAHGVGPEVYEFANQKEINIADTTCPKVIKVQKLAQLFSKKNYQLVIIGEKTHKEVRGIYEWSGKKAFFVETEEDLCDFDLDPKKKIAVISQTTQDQDFVNKIAKKIARKYPKTEIIDSICLTTQHRQNEIKELAGISDAVFVIGSPESANSRRLKEIAERINPKTYFIERANGIKREWVKDCEKIAVSAGASTPGWIIKEVISFLEKLGGK